MSDDLMEWIRVGERPVALVLRAAMRPERTTFVTPAEFTHQLGFVVYPRSGRVEPHLHLPLERRLTGTSEVLLVRSGRMLVEFYDEDRRLIATRELTTGDVVLFHACGHGIRMLEDSVLLEIKQGPYMGEDEKERFTP